VTQSQAGLAIKLARWRMLLQVASGIAGGFIGRQPVTTTTCYERDCSKIFHFTCPVVHEMAFPKTRIQKSRASVLSLLGRKEEERDGYSMPDSP
jgi:hypothetical protein